MVRCIGLTCYSVDIPAIGGSYTMSHGRELLSFPATVVRIEAEDGTVGWGEANTLGSNYLDGHPGSAIATVRELADFALSCDPLQAAVLVDGMDDLVTGHLPGKAAIDMAMWDLRGKLLQQPLSNLLGGAKQPHMRVFQAVSLDSPDTMARDADRALASGVRALQLKLGDDPSEDARRTRAVAEVASGRCEMITADANGGWSVGDALRFVAGIAGLDVYVEQPCRTTSECAVVASRIPLPMMLDESVKTASDLCDGVRAGAAQALNLKLVRVGGLTKAARIRDLAHGVGVKVLVDEPQGADLATAAMGALAATIGPRDLLAVSSFVGPHMPFSYAPSRRTMPGPSVEDGLLASNSAPGLGVEIDEDTLGAAVFEVSA
jgi:cis-L-3-hydroxyproline dehydratase